MSDQIDNKSRRSFLKSSTAAGVAAGFQIIKPELVRGAGREKLTAGIIGCGGRGTLAVLDLLIVNRNVELVAMADLFEDQLEESHRRLNDPEEIGVIFDRIKVAPDRRHIGFDAYKKIVDSDVDIVMLTMSTSSC